MESVDEVIERIIQRWLRSNPIEAHSLGIHDYDGVLPDYSPERIENRLREIDEDLAQIKRKLEQEEDRYKRFEYNIIRYRLESEAFALKDWREYEENPMVYLIPLVLIETSYTARSFDTVDNRLRSVVRIEKQIPAYLRQARQNLKENLARVKVELSLQLGQGIVSYLRDTLFSFAVKSDDEELIQQWSLVNVEACESLDSFLNALREEYLPSAHDDFPLGEERFLNLLNMSENLNFDVDTLLRAGEEDMEKNLKQLEEIRSRRGNDFIEKVMRDHPEPERLLQEVSEGLTRIRDFLASSGIVTLPTDKPCEVIETPRFARNFAFAAMNTPGPFEVEEASEAYYWVTPPDPSWDRERREEFMRFFSYAFLETVAIHEVWPGHYLQLLFSNQTESRIVKIFARSVTMIEGWAHYAEEMMYEVGYRPFDGDALHVGQLLGALMRDCRFIAAIRMHCKGMTIEEAEQLFMEKALMSQKNAAIEARRGTIDPMYLNYTLGKLLIKKLRRDIQEEKGDKFSLREFHDTLLSHGSPPIVALRELLLEEPGHELL